MPRNTPARKIILTATAREDFSYWEQDNPKIIEKINALFESILIDPMSGIGKPEKLKYELAGLWSRRINQKGRMVYQFDDNTITVLQLRDHY